jgi:hypothetical protein
MSENLGEEMVDLVKDVLSRNESPTDPDVDRLREISERYSARGWLRVIWKAYRKAVKD